MAAAAAMVGGGVISAYGQLQQGHAARAAGEFNAKIAEQNAQLARQQAAEEERRFKSVFRRQMGDNRASIAKSGIQLDGSALDVLEDSSAQAQMDAANIKYNGELQAYKFEQEAAMQRYQGAMGLQGAYYGAAASLLSAGGQASNYYARR
jgi:hypothetical protein